MTERETSPDPFIEALENTAASVLGMSREQVQLLLAEDDQPHDHGHCESCNGGHSDCGEA
jgi:hypothetical protein